MSKIELKIRSDEDEFPTFDVADDVLESAGGADAWVNYTYYNCTGYGYCPGY
jgi:hypothetical protein